jgi:hypothetical protein
MLLRIPAHEAQVPQHITNTKMMQLTLSRSAAERRA